MGNSDGGAMKGIVDGVRSLIENYEEVGKKLIALAAIYGIFRAALVVSSITQGALVSSSVSALKEIKALTAAQTALNKVISMNPYVLAVAGIAAIAVGLWGASKATYSFKSEMSKFHGILKDVSEEYNQEAALLDALYTRLKNTEKGTKDYEDAKGSVIRQFGKYSSTLDEEISKVDGLTKTYDMLANAIWRASTTRGYEGSIKEAADNYGKQRKKPEEDIINALTERYGDGGIEIYSQLKDYLDGGEITNEVESIFKSFDAAISSGVNAVGSIKVQGTANALRDASDQIRKAGDVYNATIKEIDTILKVRNSSKKR